MYSKYKLRMCNSVYSAVSNTDLQRVRRYTDMQDCDVACNGSAQYNAQS